MEAQEIFDKVARHLLTQKRKAMDAFGCVYRNASGDKCAAGCLLEEGSLAQKAYCIWPFSLHWVPSGDSEEDLKRQADIIGHYDLVLKLQKIHDYKDISDWYHTLECLAIGHELSAEVLKEFDPEKK